MDSYDQSINNLKSIFCIEFEKFKGTKKIRSVCCRYFKWGKNNGISTGELIDYLGISSPSILAEAGYSDEQIQAVMELIGLITDEEIESTII